MSPSPRSPRSLVLLLATLLAVPFAALLGAAPAHAAAFTAHGLVSDGIGDPLAGVTVAALPAPSYSAVASSTTTNADGEYDLSLTAGTYHLRYAKGGFETAFYDGATTVAVVVDGDGDISVDGEPVEDNALGDMALTSTTNHTVTGSVRNASSAALAGITVDVFTSGGDEAPVDSATTNGSGAYTLDVPTGVYWVHFTDPAQDYLATWYGGAEPEDVTITGNQTLDSVTMTSPPPASEYPIAGTVLDALGEPVAGVAVSVTPVGVSTDSGTVNTDAGGAYAVSVLPGTYQVSYTKTGWASTKYGGQSSPSTVTVGNAGTLSVAPAEDLSGNRLGDVTLASNPFAANGAVKTGGGAGITGISVRAFPEGSTDPADVVDTDTSGAAGAYSLALPVGVYDLEYVDGDGNAPTYTTTSLAQVQVAQGGVITVGGGAPVATLPDVTMAPSSADTPHAVVGSVVDVNGAEVDGLTVSAVPQSGTPGANAASAATGADGALGDHGRYRLMLKPGDYLIEVDGGAHWVDATYDGQGSGAALVTIQLNGTVLVNGVEAVGGELGATEVLGSTKYALSGTVREGGTGLAGITVKAYAESAPESAVATTTSGANGTWTLTGAQGLVVGSYLVEFSGSAGGVSYDRVLFGGATPKPVEMAQGGSAKVDGDPLAPANTLPAVSMTRSSADTVHPVPGELTDVNGDAIAGATVTVTPQGDSPAAGPFTTDADGLYTLMLKPGTYTVTYAKTGFTTATYPGPGVPAVSVTVQMDGSAPTLEPVALADATGDTAISGTVVAAVGGAPVAGITAEVYPEGDLDPASRVATSAQTTASGAWSITTLKIGTYTVRFVDTDGAEPTYITTFLGGADLASASPVKVGQGQVTVNDVPKPGGALGATSLSVSDASTTYDLIGEVADANGDPIDGVAVTAVPQAGTPAGNQVTDQSGADGALGDHGRYRLAVKAGTYRITFTKTGFDGATFPGGGETAIDIVVTAGSSERELDGVTLEQTTGATAISGRVTSGGSNVAGITVEVFPEDDFSEAALKTATTGADGTWSVTGLRIGTYTVRFTDNVAAAPTYVQKAIGPVKVGQGTNNVYLGDALKPGGALGDVVIVQADATTVFDVSGAVVDANFDAIEGATVSAVAKSGGANATTTTDQDGAYTLELKAGTYEIAAVKAGVFDQAYVLNSEGARAQVVVASNGALSVTGDGPVTEGMLDLTLASTVTYPLAGTVVNTDAAPIPGITVRALVDGSPSGVTTTTAANGTFTLQLPVGTYTVEFVDTVPAAPSYITTSFGGTTPKLVKVSANGTSHITDADTGDPIAGAGTITMEAASADTTYDVKGLVLDEAYEPLDGATVLVLPVNATSDTQAVATGTTGADPEAGEEHGYYRIPVRAGRYVLKYKAAGHMTTYLTSFDTGKPAVVTVAASGITSPGFVFTGNQIEDVQLLLPAPTMVTAPKLSGKIAVGEKVTTTVGRWNPNIEQYADWKDYVTIEWFIDGVPADDYSSGYYYQSYKIPAEAAGKRLSYRITIEDANPDGPFRSPIVFTSKPVLVPKATPTLTASYKKGALTVVVKVAGISKPLGTITVVDGKKKIGTIKLTAKSKGKAVLKLKKLKPGKHKLTISYSGDATVSPAKTKLKIKV